mgnify:CR=1 FL=1
MRFRVLMSLLAFVLCLLPSHAKAAEQLQTAGSASMRRSSSGMPNRKDGTRTRALISVCSASAPATKSFPGRRLPMEIAGCGAVPTLMAASKGQFYVVGIGNDESDLNAIYVRPDSPILKAKGAIPVIPMSTAVRTPCAASSSCARKKPPRTICSAPGCTSSGSRTRT